MLPTGFLWRPHLTSETLWLENVRIANYTVGYPYTLAYKAIGLREYTGHSFASEDAARAYLEAWACKWEMRIREAYAKSVH